MVYENIIPYIPQYDLDIMTEELTILFERILNLDFNKMKQLFTRERQDDIIDHMISNDRYHTSISSFIPITGNILNVLNSIESGNYQNNLLEGRNIDPSACYQEAKINCVIDMNDKNNVGTYRQCRPFDPFGCIFYFLRSVWYRLVNLDEHRIIYNYLINKLDEIERN